MKTVEIPRDDPATDPEAFIALVKSIAAKGAACIAICAYFPNTKLYGVFSEPPWVPIQNDLFDAAHQIIHAGEEDED